MMIGVRIVGMSMWTGRGIKKSSRVLEKLSLDLGDGHPALYICKALSSSTIKISAKLDFV